MWYDIYIVKTQAKLIRKGQNGNGKHISQINVGELNVDVLCKVVDAARAKVNDKAWISAIDKAYDYLLTSDDVILAADDGSALIPSSTGDDVHYAANGDCACKAGQRGKPCWHRAAARLIKRYRDAVAQEEKKHKALFDRVSNYGYNTVH
jgi:hypothetical protein